MRWLGWLAKRLLPEGIPGFAADLYDRAARTAIASYYREVAAEIAARMDSGRILDIGTGPGYLAIEIARRGPGLRIEGIDLTRKLIERARVNAEEAGVAEQIDFDVGDGNNLAFEDSCYDMVISTGALHSWKTPVRVLNECYRVLKPGGEAWIYDPARIMSREDYQQWQRSLGWFDRLVYAWTTFISGIPPQTYTLDQARNMVRQTRFRDYEVEQKDWIRIRLRKS